MSRDTSFYYSFLVLPPRHPDPVAEIEQLEDAEVDRRHRVLPDVDLQPRLAVGQHQEIGLAEAADRQHAPGGAGQRR
jgi:hypothetical protein